MFVLLVHLMSVILSVIWMSLVILGKIKYHYYYYHYHYYYYNHYHYHYYYYYMNPFYQEFLSPRKLCWCNYGSVSFANSNLGILHWDILVIKCHKIHWGKGEWDKLSQCLILRLHCQIFIFGISRKIYTWLVMLWFVVVISSAPAVWCDLFTHILHGCFPGTGATIWLQHHNEYVI